MQKNISQLKNSFEFNVVFKEGISFNHKFLGIYALDKNRLLHRICNSKKYNRDIDTRILIGFSINKKVAKASKRNLLKRRIKFIMRNVVNSGLNDNVALVFVCRNGILQWDFTDLNAHIFMAMNKISIRLQKRLNT